MGPRDRRGGPRARRLGRHRVLGADLAIVVDRPDRRRPLVERGVRGRGRARAHRPVGHHAPACASSRSRRSEAEHVATGVPCGTQDQLTSVFGARRPRGAASTAARSTIEPLPLPPSIGVLVVHSGVPRTLEGSPCAQRRAESFAVAAALGAAGAARRDARTGRATSRAAGTSSARWHASSRSRDALRAGDLDALGPLMLASHASSRDDMEVSTPELDALVECLVHAGALGARLTGAGFGGCVVALVPVADADEIAARAVAEYRSRTGREPTAWNVAASDGAGAVDARGPVNSREPPHPSG